MFNLINDQPNEKQTKPIKVKSFRLEFYTATYDRKGARCSHDKWVGKHMRMR